MRMERNRWKSLDFEPRPAPGGEGATERGGEGARGRGGDGQRPARLNARTPERPDALPAVVIQAMSAYMLRNYQAVVDLLEPRLRDEPELAGGQRTLGHALVRLNREPEAIDRLREAIRQSTSDWVARASLATLLMRLQEESIRLSVAEAAAHLEAALAEAPRPALRELLGAARWQSGQAALQSGQHAEAARQFASAGTEFAIAAETSGAARRALPVRRSSAFVGQAVALLLEGRIEAAQGLFSRSPVSGVAVGDPLGRFAAGLYDLCEELARVTEPERLEAAAALRDVVLQVRLEVGFYDGRQAVSLTWTSGLS